MKTGLFALMFMMAAGVQPMAYAADADMDGETLDGVVPETSTPYEYDESESPDTYEFDSLLPPNWNGSMTCSAIRSGIRVQVFNNRFNSSARIVRSGRFGPQMLANFHNLRTSGGPFRMFYSDARTGGNQFSLSVTRASMNGQMYGRLNAQTRIGYVSEAMVCR